MVVEEVILILLLVVISLSRFLKLLVIGLWVGCELLGCGLISY